MRCGPFVYATVNKKTRGFTAHRFLWNLRHPDDRLDAMHDCVRTCGNRLCVNVEHLQKVPKTKDLDVARTWARLQAYGSRQENGCLVADTAYKQVGVGNRTISIHKAAYMIHNSLSEPPPEHTEDGVRMVVRHLCHEPLCFEPTHLAYGTQSENCFEDRIANGTLRRGEDTLKATITEALAREIKASKPTTRRGQTGHVTRQQRAKRFGVSEGIVRAIDNGSTWGHLSENFSNEEQRSERRARSARAKVRPWTSGMYEEALQKLETKLTIIPAVSPFVGTPCKV